MNKWTLSQTRLIGCSAIIAVQSMVPSRVSHASTGPDDPQILITVRDLTPKFLAFYAAANRGNVGSDERWTLWKKDYDFAAVPPTPAGDAIARKLLDNAWPRYAGAMDRIRQGADSLEPKPNAVMRDVARLLHVTVPIRVKVIVYVGGFEGNAFTSPGPSGVPVVAIPVESSSAGKLMAHEFTHVVQSEQAGVSVTWQRTIAQTVFAEGLAMRVTQRLFPGLPDKEYVGEFSPNWFARASERRTAILSDVGAHLAESSDDAVFRYTMGIGPAGVEREAYYVGWLVIGDLLRHGWTFDSLCRADQTAINELTREAIGRL